MMKIPVEYIWLSVFIAGPIIAREIWLHVKIAKQGNDIKWIIGFLQKNGKPKGGDK